MSTENVVFLRFKAPETTSDDTMTFIACRACRNKTYTLTEDRPGEFPLLRCAACGAHIGRMGWAPYSEETAGEPTGA